MQKNISHLSPAAARLLLACLWTYNSASYEDIIAASGISDCATLIAAKLQLRALGFVFVGDDGGEQIALPTHWSSIEEAGPAPIDL